MPREPGDNTRGIFPALKPWFILVFVADWARPWLLTAVPTDRTGQDGLGMTSAESGSASIVSGEDGHRHCTSKRSV